MPVVFRHSVGGSFKAVKQVVPVDYEAEVSQRLIDAVHSGDLKSALEIIGDPFLDVNHVGTVYLKSRRAEVVQGEEIADEVRAEFEEFKTDVTALFLASHRGNVALVRKLLSVGADVNQKVFRGFATTAAVREDNGEILGMLLKAGASQPACEEALLEASCHGQADLAYMLMASELIRQNVALHALVTASSRGFTGVVATLIKCGVDADGVDRVLLRSLKPPLHTNVDCTALVAAVVGRQATVVHQLLQAGVRTDCEVKLGAWSWDPVSGEELRVGAGLAEAYGITWCAVEYYECSGAILRALLHHHHPIDTPHQGRTLIFHSILCNNPRALNILLDAGSNPEFTVRTKRGLKFRPIHLAARLGSHTTLQQLVLRQCDLNSRTESGETALMLCVKGRHEECFLVVTDVGADFGLVNYKGQSAFSIAESNGWCPDFERVILNAIRLGKKIHSSDHTVFSPLLFVARSGDSVAMRRLLEKESGMSLNEQDQDGNTPVMAAVSLGFIDMFRVLVFAGADVRLPNKKGETVFTLSESFEKRDEFEQVMLEFALERGDRSVGFCALHCAARRGDLRAVQLLAGMGCGVDTEDEDGYTPLMLAAKGGHAHVCRFLIGHGANVESENWRGETPLTLAQKSGVSEAESVVLDELARRFVVGGGRVGKHTREGKGRVHGKVLCMVVYGGRSVVSWGTSGRRNVVCKEARVGASAVFRKNRMRKGKGDANAAGLFRVVTTKGREVHFVAQDGWSAELWVRGINLLTTEATSFVSLA
ncbi:ankyrin repeat domain-containing protein 50 isoform X1 [Amborella trichopoda]|uniref:PH domain-containing protein n=2 Tax=Amborella trichopoda TaxID=13333 RepID=W1PIA4_AMBTC|nr:ankyrin repeat domain-containing protein 50 isoform X1 [Amborella trichopoda]ERN06840.1 hypothetical protein AMTR_s00005p00232410 [Amborella trichopoda]|eukprot:XP_006845165.1 ankyrin repeat domain-containing protein 50 isoform X1 [Amborella trichopoda]